MTTTAATIDHAPTALETVTTAVLARIRVDARAMDVARVRIAPRDGHWHVTAVGYTGETVLTGAAVYTPGRRPVVHIGAPVAKTRHQMNRPANNRPAGRRDSTRPAGRAPVVRPDVARMAGLDWDGLADYAVELLDAGHEPAAAAVYDEIERRDRAERATREAAEQDDAHRTERARAAVDRRRGERTRDALRREYREWLEVRYVQAENECKHMLSPRGRQLAARDEIHPRDLFTGPLQHARPYASTELLQWWERNGRITFAQWQAQYGGDSRARAAATSPRTGRDYV